jgi:signal transduction histidine kinase
LLEWSRIQVGSLVPKKNNINISELLKRNIDGLATQALAKNIHVKDEFDDELVVYADDKMVSTIVRNLLSNAIKFTPDGGSITVVSAKKIIGDNKIIETEIRDTGVGISEENVNKLFKIEQNYRSKGTNDETGTGLGLILCQEFLNQNNGTIRVESEPNVGSSFIFTLECAM